MPARPGSRNAAPTAAMAKAASHGLATADGSAPARRRALSATLPNLRSVLGGWGEHAMELGELTERARHYARVRAARPARGAREVMHPDLGHAPAGVDALHEQLGADHRARRTEREALDHLAADEL